MLVVWLGSFELGYRSLIFYYSMVSWFSYDETLPFRPRIHYWNFQFMTELDFIGLRPILGLVMTLGCEGCARVTFVSESRIKNFLEFPLLGDGLW